MMCSQFARTAESSFRYTQLIVPHSEVYSMICMRQRILYLADFVIVPVTIVILANVAGLTRVPFVLAGFAVWTLAEYLLHRFGLHWFLPGLRLHQPHHDHPGDIGVERSSLSTPMIACPIGIVLMAAVGVNDGAALMTGLLSGYLAFIVVHHAVHRWTIEGNSWLYAAKLRHITHHHFDHCNYGVTTAFWDIVFRTNAVVERRALSK